MSDRKRIQIALATTLYTLEPTECCCSLPFTSSRRQPSIPHFAPPVPPEDTELQPSTLVSVLTYRLCPLRRVPLIKQNP
jgi:hypothetical protein